MAMGSSPVSQLPMSSRMHSKGCRAGPLSAHSHSTRVRQPDAASLLSARSSRALLLAIFVVQNSTRVAGSLNIGQLWPCQKQPCTRMTARNLRNTRSGQPGKSFRCNRNRIPRACKPRRNISSGLVFVPRIRLMLSRRCSGVRTSAICSPCCGIRNDRSQRRTELRYCHAGAHGHRAEPETTPVVWMEEPAR